MYKMTIQPKGIRLMKPNLEADNKDDQAQPIIPPFAIIPGISNFGLVNRGRENRQE